MNPSMLILLSLVAVAIGLPQGRGYGAPPPSYQPAPKPPVSCPKGQVDRGDGTCATPTVTRNLFLFNAPAQKVKYGPAPEIPDPKAYYNFVFIRTADAVNGPEPIVAPAPQQKTLVYVLSKKQTGKAQELIQVESEPTQPDVYFVNYKEGENVDLPGGIDLETALSQAVVSGEVIESPHSGGSYSAPAPPPAPPTQYYSSN